MKGFFGPLANDQGPGMAVGVIRDGKLVFAKGYRLADLENKTRIVPETDLRLASVTKQFTANVDHAAGARWEAALRRYADQVADLYLK